MAGRKPKYGIMGSDASGYFAEELPDHIEEWRAIPKQFHDPLHEVIEDLTEALYGAKNAVERNQGEKAELVGVTNSLCCAHDVLHVFQEAGVNPPKLFTEIHRTLEKRRDELDPSQSKGPHR
jgi:hypothetical protein